MPEQRFVALEKAVADFMEEHYRDNPVIIDGYTSGDASQPVSYREISVASGPDFYVFRQWRYGSKYGEVDSEVVSARQIRIYSQYLSQKSPR